MVIRRAACRIPVCHPVRAGESQSAQESAVIAGQADLASLEEGDLQSLAIQYPAASSYPNMGTAYASLNTRLPPFTNLKARQAVNYAIDRARILRSSISPPVRPP